MIPTQETQESEVSNYSSWIHHVNSCVCNVINYVAVIWGSALQCISFFVNYVTVFMYNLFTSYKQPLYSIGIKNVMLHAHDNIILQPHPQEPQSSLKKIGEPGDEAIKHIHTANKIQDGCGMHTRLELTSQMD